jgi:filamentous hemagglutinin
MQNANSSGNATSSHQNASVVNGDSVAIVSRTGDVRVVGSGIVAENDVAIVARQGSVDILSGQDSNTQSSDSSGQQIGDLGGNGYAGTVGVHSESHHLDEAANTQSTVRSQVVSGSGSVSVTAKEDLTARGADISAGRDVTLIGKNVVLDPGEDSLTRNQVDKSSQYGVTLALSGYSVQAAQAAENAGRTLESGNGKAAALYAVQAGVAAVNTSKASDALGGAGKLPVGVEKTGNPSNSNGGSALIKATVSIGGGSQDSEVHSEQSAFQGTTINAGNSVTIVATGSGAKDADGFATDGDISARGVQIGGKDVTLVAARGINIESAQDTASQSSRSSGSNASIGVGLGLGGQQNGFTLELAASQNKANADGDSVTNHNSHVTASDTLNIASGRDTNLKGAQLTGDTVIADIGRDLNIESRQDRETYQSDQSSSGMQASICVPPFCVGATVSASASSTTGKTDSSYASVVEQSGIYAGNGGFNINVQGNTDLKGAVLASAAEAAKNTLTTGTLTTSDIENRAQYSSDSSTIAGSFSGGQSVGASDANLGPVQQAHTEWSGVNGVGNVVDSAMTTLAGNAQAALTGSGSGATYSAIANGTVTITDGAGQIAKTGKTAEETIAALNRDTANANEGIGKIFDAEKVKEDQANAQLMAQTMQQAAPLLYDQVGNLLKGQDGTLKIAVHALIGGVVSKALGGDFGSGAAGVAAGTAPIALLNENLGDLGLTVAEQNALLESVGMLVAGAVGKNAAAATAGMADAFNRQLHPGEKELAKKMAANSHGKYTAEQIEAQMRLSSLVDMSGKILEAGGPDMIGSATTKIVDGDVRWNSVAVTTRITEIQAQADAEIIGYIQSQQKEMLGDLPYVSRLDYSGVIRFSSTPLPVPTAQCGVGQADCVAGIPAGYSTAEIALRRNNVADIASLLGAQAGRASTLAATVGSMNAGNPIVALPADTLSLATGFAGWTLGLVEQIFRPDVGQYYTESILGVGVGALGNKVPIAGPALNEFGEVVKGTKSMELLKNYLNEKWGIIFNK